MSEQLRIDAEPELIPGAKRDAQGRIETRWVRLERTTKGLLVVAPKDVKVFLRDDGKVELEWT